MDIATAKNQAAAAPRAVPAWVPAKPEPEPRRAQPTASAIAVWFRRSVWLGIVCDVAAGLSGTFAPASVLEWLGMRPTHDPIWTSFGAMLLVLLSLSYIPGASQPYKYRFSAWFTVSSRLAGALFFLLLHPGHYTAFGVLDASLFALQLPLLIATMRKRPAVEPPRPEALQAPPEDRSLAWLRGLIWLGVLADCVPGLFGIFAPETLLGLLGFRQTHDALWTSYAGLNLSLLGLSYIPGAIAPYTYRFTAALAVFARPPGVLFFLVLWPNVYPAFGIMDAALFLATLAFLIKTTQLVPVRRFWDTDVFDYRGASFRQVRDVAFSGPYEGLPKHKGVGPGTFLQLCADAARNMHDRRDIRPRYDKLIHSHGVCYSGLWKIDQKSPYTGYFSQGSEGLLIARTSVAAAFVTQGHRRALGIAGKLFPTLDPDAWVWPGNFVTVSNLSGSRARHVLDIDVSNFAGVGLDPGANLINRVIFRFVDTRPGYRQLFPISSLGLQPGESVVTPDLMLLRPAPGTPRIDARDFRDEIRLANYPGNRLVYDILLKDFGDPEWKRVGSITFSEDTISEGSDKRLHFWIPRDLPNVHETVDAS